MAPESAKPWFERTVGWDAAIFLALMGSILWRARPEFQLDEERFVQYADNLIRGFYADSQTKYLWNGPGYPLILAPFRLLGIPLIFAKMLNAGFFLGTLLYVRKILALYLPRDRALPISYAAFAYFALFGWPWLHLLMTESLAACLIAGYTFHFCAGFRETGKKIRRRHFTGAALVAAFLALTKFFFAYALLAQIALGLGLAVFRNRMALRGAALAGAALILCLPYLAYTYRLTGRIFYWGNTGGSQLYTLTVPEKHLLGDVIPMDLPPRHPELFPSVVPVLASMQELDEVERDRRFRQAAWENIRKNPAKVFKNWRANVNRLVFDYPFSRFPGSHSRQGTGNLSFVFAPVWFAVLLCLYPTWRRFRIWPQEFLWMLGFAALSLGGLSLLSAYARFVFPLLPILLCWIGFTAVQVLWGRMPGRVDA